MYLFTHYIKTLILVFILNITNPKIFVFLNKNYLSVAVLTFFRYTASSSLCIPPGYSSLENTILYNKSVGIISYGNGKR